MNEPRSRFPQSSEELRSFLSKYLTPLTRHAGFMLNDYAEAEDVVQEAFIRAYGMRESLSVVDNPAGYMFKFVSNGCLDAIRRRNSHDRTVSGLYLDSVASVTESREEELIREERQQGIRDLLTRIPEEQARVIRYRFAEGLTFPEISMIAGVPVTTVKSRFTYGMMKLRSMIHEK